MSQGGCDAGCEHKIVRMQIPRRAGGLLGSVDATGDRGSLHLSMRERDTRRGSSAGACRCVLVRALVKGSLQPGLGVFAMDTTYEPVRVSRIPAGWPMAGAQFRPGNRGCEPAGLLAKCRAARKPSWVVGDQGLWVKRGALEQGAGASAEHVYMYSTIRSMFVCALLHMYMPRYIHIYHVHCLSAAFGK